MARRKREGKRAYLKRFASDYINTLERVDNERMRTYYERTQTTRGPKNNKEPVLNNTFMQEVPVTKGRMDGKGAITPREEAQIVRKQYLLAQSERLQKLAEVNSITMMDHPKFKIRLKFVSGRGFWFEKETPTAIYTSVGYENRDMALFYWELGLESVHWTQVELKDST